VAVTDSVEQGHSQLAEFAQASYGLPLADLEQIQALAAGPLDVVADKLDRYVAAGARHLAVRIATTTLATQRDQLEQIIKLKHMLNQAASGTNPGRASTAPADPGTGLPGRRVS
jgi:hypothetical protein